MTFMLSDLLGFPLPKGMNYKGLFVAGIVIAI